ncbi:LPXTG cell wall anchor domain-containing protein [Kitasatospora phosalacinea]|uniref:LPXTG cell wall anchor domain-containing protein n=1 Tax=Kitasatospora phosalacinea TaxID=2065 RepID=A0ABW6GR32_9ACTN
MHRSIALRAAAVVVAAGLMSAPAVGSAFASSSTYTSQLRQQVPTTAAAFGEQEKTCADIPATQDGWHFVLPGNDADFVKLTVTFQPGGEQVVTSFPGNPAGKHAYVASAKGATLVSAVAEVRGGSQAKFNLSHTCPASAPEASPSPKASESPLESPEPSASASESTSASPSPSESPETSGSPSASPSPSEGTSGSPSPSAAESTSGAAVSPSASATTGPADDSLAFTGASVIGTTVAGLALLGAGGVLVSRRRKGAHR